MPSMSVNPNGFKTSADATMDFQQSGIRATSDKCAGIKPTSTTLPCQHCTDEQNERIRRVPRAKLCYYCHSPGHQIYNCKVKEDDEVTQLLRQAINSGTKRQEGEVHCRDEMMVTGTEGGLWSDIWYVNPTFDHHFSGNLNLFKRVKHVMGVETKTGMNNFMFIRGVGNVEIKTGNETMRIHSVFYSPDLDRNVLSLDQLTLQGFTVKKSGDTCKIYPMFSSPVVNAVSEISGMSKEEELGLYERRKLQSLCSDDDEFKEKYLNSYFETLNVSNEYENDWTRMIIRAIEFHEFTDCKALLDMIDDRDFIFKYKYDLEVKFEEMVGWFLKEKMGITSRSIPPMLTDGRKINLLGLYVMVERDGGYRSVTIDNLWPAIAKDLGFEYQDGDFIRVIYVMYLDVLIYYYKFKVTEEKVQIKEMMEKGETSAAGKDKGGSKSADPTPEDAASEHYALYAGNSWEGSWILHKKRRRFDFKEAKKAVDEANRSVQAHAAKYNQV
ncbi:putative transcription factor interactor and regulator CCHC(Zn) family [Helianthus annuus]|nr:putative transcription factor interactor and regulator CCHC(Zn) family [Helianthus annuus]KAJ0617878.1 putative transcription factor interactor and regulator ARID family [Helianthus annuus]